MGQTRKDGLQNYMVPHVEHYYKWKVMCTVYVLGMLQKFTSLFHRVVPTDDKCGSDITINLYKWIQIWGENPEWNKVQHVNVSPES